MGLTAQMNNTHEAFSKLMLRRMWWKVWRPDGTAVVCVYALLWCFECARIGIPSTTKPMIGTALPAGCEPGISRGGRLVPEVPFHALVR